MALSKQMLHSYKLEELSGAFAVCELDDDVVFSPPAVSQGLLRVAGGHDAGVEPAAGVEDAIGDAGKALVVEADPSNCCCATLSVFRRSGGVVDKEELVGQIGGDDDDDNAFSVEAFSPLELSPVRIRWRRPTLEAVSSKAAFKAT